SARYVADRIIVMYAGHMVEAGPAESVLAEPKHPYTQLLLSAVADPGEQAASISGDTGEPPRVINPGEGCRFRRRCAHAVEKCSQVTPPLPPIGSAQVACHVAARQAADVPTAAPPAPTTPT